jgi:hypothetical protein
MDSDSIGLEWAWDLCFNKLFGKTNADDPQATL